MAEPSADLARKIRGLTRRRNLHVVLALAFAALTVGSAKEDEVFGFAADRRIVTVIRWEMIVYGGAITLTNLVLAFTTGRRAARLGRDPDADTPEAKAFE